MIHKVIKKLYTSRHCFICGEENDFGAKAKFYQLDNGEIAGIFQCPFEHSGYPGRLHGGIASAIIDEAVGRAILVSQPNTYGVTIELSTKYRKPVPVCEELRVISRITSVNERVFEGTAEILLDNGDVAVSGWAKYLKMPIEKIADESIDADELLHNSDDLEFIDY